MVEIMIYSYLAICLGMIGFNVVCIFVYRRQDKLLHRRSADFEKQIERQIRRGRAKEDEEQFLMRKLRKIPYLMAFDETLERLYQQDPEQTEQYIESIYPVFIYLTFEYMEKDPIQAAYFPYLIKKHRIFRGKGINSLSDAMMRLIKVDNLYCRENALEALYTIGDADHVIEAFRILDRSGAFFHPKMITDGLFNFSGPQETLNDRLWSEFPRFSPDMKVAILNYFRFGTVSQPDRVLKVMTDPTEDDEVRYSCIRYFGKFRCEQALPYLYDYVELGENQWVYAAVAASALANYPGPRTVEALKALLCNRNWYIRYNAAESLEKLGLEYEELISAFDGEDRYAAEMLQYRFDRNKLKHKEVANP